MDRELDPKQVIDDLAEYIYKEAGTMEYEYVPPWLKLSRGILNPMTQESKIFKTNLDTMIQKEWI